MNNNEVNKIIAEFMNLEIEVAKNGCVLTPTIDRFWYPVKYCDSLDALVPVWEKLGGNNVEHVKGVDGWFSVVCGHDYYKDDKRETIQQAAAHTTAKVILKLKEQEK